ncbi:MAG: diguanylate cyclase [Asticcacaulis sp.]
MSSDVDITVRSPSAFALARMALEQMEAQGVWPTPLNYELWLYVVGDPEGDLAQEIHRILGTGDPFTEEVAEGLAAKHIARLRLSDEIRDAGAQLTRELTTIAQAVADVQRSQKAYGRTLEGAKDSLETADSSKLRALVENLSAATVRMISENSTLEQKLSESTREVTRLREHLEQVRRDAMTDALTNLANRKSFDEQLERCCQHSEDSGSPLTLAVIDIDHFKRFNDTWGHQTGDQVIRYVASVLGRVGRPPRIAARYGGEEFGLIFPGETALSVERLLNEVREEIASRVLKRRSTNEDLGTVTISAGLAQREDAESPFKLMDRADKALYRSKNMGRNRVTCFKE